MRKLPALGLAWLHPENNVEEMTVTRLWDRGLPLDEMVLMYTAGDDAILDDNLVAYDVRASIAHADMLLARGYLSVEHHGRLTGALADLASSHAAGEWHVGVDEEDCHTAIENRLVLVLGEVGGSIHLGRSRNDQVLAALRLWLKDQLGEMAGLARQVAAVLEDLGQRYQRLQIPGYTHQQRAMPSSIEMWAKGFADQMLDDAEGLVGAIRRADLNPLGSAAGYGVPVLDLDREMTTKLLGFAATQKPVTAVQLSRGKAEATALFEAAIFAQDLGRLAAELCLFASAEFGFVKLSHQFTTGSSIMPQKRNPDVFEIARGRSAESVGALNEVLGIMGKMTSGYHRDLQLVKKPLFRGLQSVRDTAVVMAIALGGIEFVKDRLDAAMDESMLATKQAYELVVKEKIPFRDAYRRIKDNLS